MALMTENNIPQVSFGHPAPLFSVVDAEGSTEAVLAEGSTEAVLAEGSTDAVLPVEGEPDESVGAFLSLVEVSGGVLVTEVEVSAFLEVVGATAVELPSSFPTAADDTILATEISPTRTKTKVFLLKTILLFGNVVSSF